MRVIAGDIVGIETLGRCCTHFAPTHSADWGGVGATKVWEFEAYGVWTLSQGKRFRYWYLHCSKPSWLLDSLSWKISAETRTPTRPTLRHCTCQLWTCSNQHSQAPSVPKGYTQLPIISTEPYYTLDSMPEPSRKVPFPEMIGAFFVVHTGRVAVAITRAFHDKGSGRSLGYYLTLRSLCGFSWSCTRGFFQLWAPLQQLPQSTQVPVNRSCGGACQAMRSICGIAIHNPYLKTPQGCRQTLAQASLSYWEADEKATAGKEMPNPRFDECRRLPERATYRCGHQGPQNKDVGTHSGPSCTTFVEKRRIPKQRFAIRAYTQEREFWLFRTRTYSSLKVCPQGFARIPFDLQSKLVHKTRQSEGFHQCWGLTNGHLEAV